MKWFNVPRELYFQKDQKIYSKWDSLLLSSFISWKGKTNSTLTLKMSDASSMWVNVIVYVVKDIKVPYVM